ncbi:MAG: hypothetical protein IJB55_06605 [Firmicutes bacterium]|nr:hypothetical protein [Bacillota bacterium]
MKKLALLLICLLPILAGCHSSKDNMIRLGDMMNPNEFSAATTDSIVHQAAAEATDETLLYIINEPAEEDIDELLAYQLLKLEDDAPVSLLVPSRQNTKMVIYPLLYTSDADGYQRGPEVWSTDVSDKGLVIAMQAARGQAGHPAYEIYVECNSYYASYFWEMPTGDDGDTAELPQFEMVEFIAEHPTFTGLD